MKCGVQGLLQLSPMSVLKVNDGPARAAGPSARADERFEKMVGEHASTSHFCGASHLIRRALAAKVVQGGSDRVVDWVEVG